MIAYSLCCHKGHVFEGWFGSSVAFDQQAEAGQLSCPTCKSVRVQKSMMAPSVAGTKKSRSKAEAKQMRQFATGLRKYVQENADYVGPKFAEEARKVHYGEAASRAIYGEATSREARELVEEGVDVASLPPDPESTN